MTIIYISMILALSLMGVGYGYWGNGLITDISMKTGFTNPLFYLEDDEFNVDDGELSFILSEDQQRLKIEGEIFPTFDQDIKIEIIDEGNIPSVLDNVEQEDFEISDLKGRKKSSYSRMLNSREEYIESFDLNINSSKLDNNTDGLNMRRSSDEASGLEGQIERLKDEIRAYDHEEEYKFKYKLLFEQGL